MGHNGDSVFPSMATSHTRLTLSHISGSALVIPLHGGKPQLIWAGFFPWTLAVHLLVFSLHVPSSSREPTAASHPSLGPLAYCQA